MGEAQKREEHEQGAKEGGEDTITSERFSPEEEQVGEPLSSSLIASQLLALYHSR